MYVCMYCKHHHAGHSRPENTIPYRVVEPREAEDPYDEAEQEDHADPPIPWHRREMTMRELPQCDEYEQKHYYCFNRQQVHKQLRYIAVNTIYERRGGVVIYIHIRCIRLLVYQVSKHMYVCGVHLLEVQPKTHWSQSPRQSKLSANKLPSRSRTRKATLETTATTRVVTAVYCSHRTTNPKHKQN